MNKGNMKPILFNTEMVRAILEGRKTVTRRVMKPQPAGRPERMREGSCWPGYFASVDDERVYRPPYHPGDILWVRETWSPVNVRPRRYIYKADVDRSIGEGVGLPLCWHPSIHMPREAARIFLRVTGVRVERLREMVLADVLMEGIQEQRAYEDTWDLWHQTWDSTIKPADRTTYGWKANPWVWVISFERAKEIRL